MHVVSQEKLRWDERSTTIERLYAEQSYRVAMLEGTPDTAKMDAAKRGLTLLTLARDAHARIPKDWKLKPGEYVTAYFLHGPSGRSIAEELIESVDRQLAEATGYPIAPLCMLYRDRCPKCYGETELPIFERVHGGSSKWFVACQGCGAQEMKML